MMETDHAGGRAALNTISRPQSRASTTSAQSGTAQMSLNTNMADAAGVYGTTWMSSQEHARAMGNPAAMTANEMMLHSQMQQSQSQGYGLLDTALAMAYQQQQHQHQHQQPHPHPHQHYQEHAHHDMRRHRLPHAQYASPSPFPEQKMSHDDVEEGDTSLGGSGRNRGSISKTAANNELELRALFRANSERSLGEVAADLHGNDRGPNSERSRQIFAMLWINLVCSVGKGSVPRGRVYAHYASRCATERITVLNPASFGKLVRVLFPGLKTRRLGVRGESKYHYVNFHLTDDQPDIANKEDEPKTTKLITSSEKIASPVSNHGSTQPSATQLGEVTTSIPAPRPSNKASSRSAARYHYPLLHNGVPPTSKSRMKLAFRRATSDGPIAGKSGEISLPAIEPYLPSGTDVDAAKSLSALYRSHCISLAECLRYCKLKEFLHHYTSFQGTLTMPVQKLFARAELAPWIERCDLVLYQTMISIISSLALQVVPKQVLEMFRSISDKLVSHIRESFQGLPLHVLRAKEGPAGLFASLLDRILRVNLAAHAAANMLSRSANRDKMYLDWIRLVHARKVAECVPTRGMDDVVDVLLKNIRRLIDPREVPWEIECLTPYGSVAGDFGHKPASMPDDPNRPSDLDRWAEFLKSLPERFPYASDEDLTWCVERVGTAVMREITMGQGESFAAWWVTKVFIDETLNFLMEEGGFMQQTSCTDVMDVDTAQQSTSAGQEPTSRPTSSGKGDKSFASLSQSQSQPGRAPFPTSKVQVNMGLHTADEHEDSGLGMQTPEEETEMTKFTYHAPETTGLLEVMADDTDFPVDI